MPDSGKPLLETDRLFLRELTLADASFIRELLNTPGWLRYIGDKQVATDADARGYLAGGPLESYARHGFGLYLLARREDGRAVGMCGLVSREGLEHPDLGFALLPTWEGRGYATEAARAVLDHARATLGLACVLAIVTPDNAPSIRVLTRLGMIPRGELERSGTRLRLYATPTP